jgi:hypothetical protein
MKIDAMSAHLERSLADVSQHLAQPIEEFTDE